MNSIISCVPCKGSLKVLSSLLSELKNLVPKLQPEGVVAVDFYLVTYDWVVEGCDDQSGVDVLVGVVLQIVGEDIHDGSCPVKLEVLTD